MVCKGKKSAKKAEPSGREYRQRKQWTPPSPMFSDDLGEEKLHNRRSNKHGHSREKESLECYIMQRPRKQDFIPLTSESSEHVHIPQEKRGKCMYKVHHLRSSQGRGRNVSMLDEDSISEDGVVEEPTIYMG
ncbi:uncharacterized protein LOC133821636 [Humulus lupulus]|uniref:uncharacterized protein LOC133821636 n=1 Tax=Humulus lupulus TaxID=3486 RepID=UPI002B40C87B|nr:uncharacterized protein LOC133821636 [Humulus lupulus]